MALMLDAGSEIPGLPSDSPQLCKDALARRFTRALSDYGKPHAQVPSFWPFRSKSGRLVTVRRLRVLALPPEDPGSEGAHHRDGGGQH